MHGRPHPAGDPDHLVIARRDARSQLLTAAVDSEEGPQTALGRVSTTLTCARATLPSALGTLPPNCAPGLVKSARCTSQLHPESLEPISHERHLFADLAAQACRQPMILAADEQVLETSCRAEDRLDRSGRCRVISPLHPTARRRQRSPGCRRERTQASGADVYSERCGKDVLELVGLIDDERVMFWQHLSPATQISAQEMKVHDDNVRGGCPRTSRLREALAARRAATGTRTLVGTDTHARPGWDRWLELELGPVPTAGRLGPLREAPHLFADPPCRDGSFRAARPCATPGTRRLRVRRRVRNRVERRVESLLFAKALELTETLTAEIVGPAFEHRPFHGEAEAAGHEREILVRELVLQSFGRSRDHDAFVGADGRHEVGERLAGTGTGRHGNVATRAERLRHSLGHLDLTRTHFAGRKCSHDPSQQLGDTRFGHVRTLPEGWSLSAGQRAQGLARPLKTLPARNTITISGNRMTATLPW